MQFLRWNPGPCRCSLRGWQSCYIPERLLYAGQGAFLTKNDPDPEVNPKIRRLGCYQWYECNRKANCFTLQTRSACWLTAKHVIVKVTFVRCFGMITIIDRGCPCSFRCIRTCGQSICRGARQAWGLPHISWSWSLCPSQYRDIAHAELRSGSRRRPSRLCSLQTHQRSPEGDRRWLPGELCGSALVLPEPVRNARAGPVGVGE